MADDDFEEELVVADEVLDEELDEEVVFAARSEGRQRISIIGAKTSKVVREIDVPLEVIVAGTEMVPVCPSEEPD